MLLSFISSIDVAFLCAKVFLVRLFFFLRTSQVSKQLVSLFLFFMVNMCLNLRCIKTVNAIFNFHLKEYT